MKVLKSLFTISLCSLAFAQAESLYIQSAKAPLFAEASFSSERLNELTKGREVVALDIQKRWVQVQVAGLTGWIPALLVNSEPPLNKVTLIGSEAVTLEGEARRRASAVATAGATRGLTNEAASSNLGFDYSELQSMEALTISNRDVADFALQLGADE